MNARPNAAISYTVDSFEPGSQPMGRRTAGQGLLRGFVEHSGVEAFHGFGPGGQDRAGFEAAVRRFGGTGPILWSAPEVMGSLAQVGTLHVAGPVGAVYAYQRRTFNQRGWSLTGVTHTVSSHAVMDAVASMLTGPLQTWDALICTSRAVRGVVESVFEDQTDYLRSRIGGSGPIPTLQLPVIPLGVRCADFAPSPSGRVQIRQRLGLDDDEVLVLFAARLSYHAKAHPYPMYVALQKAAERTGSRVHLLLAGWFADEFQEAVFRDGAAALCPSVTLHVLNGLEPGVWEGVWSAADVYTLLSDNIQESFGLSPVEAMATGLPVVGSDWNGLRDTIAHGETGFRVPTLGPPPGAGEFISDAFDHRRMNYDQYVAATSQVTAVDVAAAADAYAALIADADLRRRMGEAGRARAVGVYDWSSVIPQYQALWTELAERRRTDAEIAPRQPGRPANPARADPFRNFAAYSTRTLGLIDQIRGGPDLAVRAGRVFDMAGVAPVGGVIVQRAELDAITARLETAALTTAELIAAFPAVPARRMLRTVAWLHKHGLVAVEAAD